MGIQCFNCKEFRHFAKECKKPKKAKDYTYHKKNMLLCKQAEKGVSLQAEQADWLEDTDEENDERHVVEKHDSNVIPDSSNMCDNDNQANQNADECDDERVVLATSIANLKLDTDENKKIQNQLKKTNTSFSHELEECKSALKECKSSLEKYKIFQDCTNEKDTVERKLYETLGLLAQKEHDIKEGLKIKAYEVSAVKEKHDELVKQSLLTKSSYEGLVKEKNKVIKDLKLKEEKCNTPKYTSMQRNTTSGCYFIIQTHESQVQYDVKYNVFANERQHSKHPESINDKHVVEKDDSNVISDSSNMCDNDNQANENADECDDERPDLGLVLLSVG
nr:hypothetical protein [Tanacetum cinerariifolium]